MYGSPINPIPGKEAYATVNKVALPMEEVRKAGRLKKKMYKSHLEKNKDKLSLGATKRNVQVSEHNNIFQQ